MTKMLVVAEMALRETARRRSVLLMLLLLPLAFYLSRRGDHLGQSIRFVCLGLGWVLATASLFAGNAARGIEPRLRLSGYRSVHLIGGRLIALWALGLVLCAPYFALVRFDQHNVNYGAIAVIMALTIVVAAALGLTVSAILPRELEGMLLLLVILGLQMVLDPAAGESRLLPFWFSREIGTYAVDHTDGGYLARGLLHGAGFAIALTAIAVGAAGLRLRRRSHLRHPRTTRSGSVHSAA